MTSKKENHYKINTSEDNNMNNEQINKNANVLRVNNMNIYINDTLEKDIQQYINTSKIKSGYENLDMMTRLYPGLYVIGALPSLGKTTFMHQMADQIAESGQKVLLFSIEQTTLELATKSLSRIMAKNENLTNKSALDIRKSVLDDDTLEAIHEYSTYSGNITIVECSYRATLKDITDYIKNYIDKNNVKPVVIIDYLQVIQLPSGHHMTTKDVVEYHVKTLKQTQSDYNLVMMVISSFNRQNYLTQTDYESFKESGGIEYTADVVWGLQLQVLNDELFDSQGKINEKRELVREAKRANPRKVELICLKNRFGISSYNCAFDYYSEFDWFRADMGKVDLSLLMKNTDENGFVHLPDSLCDELPFV